MARILIIDDDAMVRDAIRDILESRNHTVEEAHHGRDGLDRMRQGRFDLVITDIIMPEMEGVEAMLAIREEFPGVKVIAISGGGRTANYDFLGVAGKLGANKTLQKPFKRDDLLRAVRDCLGSE